MTDHTQRDVVRPGTVPRGGGACISAKRQREEAANRGRERKAGQHGGGRQRV
jgi:hypothetical protein